jgi:glucosamine--fructose-6-phosphate aminotransferase (isomerizing)
MSLRDEILEQPQLLQRWLDTQLDRARQVAEAIRGREIDYVFLAARGTSDHAGVYAQYLWGARNRLPVAFAAPSLFTRYDAQSVPRLRHALVVGISQSGQSPDVVSVLAEGRRQGAVTLAITNAAHSPLEEAAEFALDVHAGAEKAVAATKTYTGELLVVAALSALLRDEPAALDELLRLPEAVAGAAALEAETAEVARQHRDLRQCVVLGRGYNYATAREWALKLKELAYVFADPYSAADFQHGPIAMVEPGARVLAVAPRGAVLDDLLALLRRLRDEYGAELTVLSDDEAALSLSQHPLRLPAEVPEWLSPIASIVPAQLYSYHLTLAKGYDTEAPRHIRKVTLTE